MRLMFWAIALCVITTAAPATAAPLDRQAMVTPPNLLRNGGFAQGDFRHWTLSGNTEYSQVFNQEYDGISAHGGTDYALLGPRGSDGILSQSFVDAPGGTLTISFWVASDGGTPNSFSASFDGTILMSLTDTGAFGWTHYKETVTGTGTDTLSFSFRDDQDYMALDQVRVAEVWLGDATQTVREIPAPPVLPILLPAGAAALLLRRRRRARSAIGLFP